MKAADATGKAFLGIFAAMLLGLVAAMIGAAVGARGKHHDARHDDTRRSGFYRQHDDTDRRIVTPTTPATTPVTTTGPTINRDLHQ